MRRHDRIRSAADWRDAHRDDIYEAEQAFALDAMIDDDRHIHLTPGGESGQPRFVCAYTPLK